MQFNPTDKANSIIADIDFLLFGNSETLNTDYSLTDRTRNVNIAMDEVVTELFKADPNFMWDDTSNTDFPIATTTITSGVTHVVLPSSSLVIHRVRITDTSGEYYTLTPKNRKELTDSELNEVGIPTSYYKIDNAVFFAPTPNYAPTVELEFQRGANHFTISDTNVSPGFNSQYHQLLSIKASKRYALANNMNEKVIMLTNLENPLLTSIREHYQRRSPDERPRLKLKRHNTNYGFTGR